MFLNTTPYFSFAWQHRELDGLIADAELVAELDYYDWLQKDLRVLVQDLGIDSLKVRPACLAFCILI